jgi:hypothetical protein
MPIHSKQAPPPGMPTPPMNTIEFFGCLNGFIKPGEHIYSYIETLLNVLHDLGMSIPVYLMWYISERGEPMLQIVFTITFSTDYSVQIFQGLLAEKLAKRGVFIPFHQQRRWNVPVRKIIQVYTMPPVCPPACPPAPRKLPRSARSSMKMTNRGARPPPMGSLSETADTVDADGTPSLGGAAPNGNPFGMCLTNVLDDGSDWWISPQLLYTKKKIQKKKIQKKKKKEKALLVGNQKKKTKKQKKKFFLIFFFIIKLIILC